VKLLLDANLSSEVARLLKEAGHDAIHVRDIGLLNAPDPEVLQATADGGQVLLTADAGFGALRALGSLASPPCCFCARPTTCVLLEGARLRV
jgi:predicted nuclease of predicted toxin-antitoxin system